MTVAAFLRPRGSDRMAIRIAHHRQQLLSPGIRRKPGPQPPLIIDDRPITAELIHRYSREYPPRFPRARRTRHALSLLGRSPLATDKPDPLNTGDASLTNSPSGG